MDCFFFKKWHRLLKSSVDNGNKTKARKKKRLNWKLPAQSELNSVRSIVRIKTYVSQYLCQNNSLKSLFLLKHFLEVFIKIYIEAFDF